MARAEWYEGNIEAIEPFQYNRENNMDDWIITDDICKIKL